jgi:DUF1365 family protein
MNSCLYVGSVRHRRFAPAANHFRYRLFMAYLDLSELPAVFDRYWFWSARRVALAWFRRADYYGDPARPLDASVRDLVAERTGTRPQGPIRLLTHLRYFGHNFNPVSFYYVYDVTGTRLEHVVAEITNTPWKERHAYVLNATDGESFNNLHGQPMLRWQFDKAFHVSPFLPLDLRYDWRMSAPAEVLYVHMQTRRNGELQLDATLDLRRRKLSSGALSDALCAFPVMTLRLVTLIYWQALKLRLRRVPFFAHPEGKIR